MSAFRPRDGSVRGSTLKLGLAITALALIVGASTSGLPDAHAGLPTADLSLTKSDSPDPVAAGGVLTYTLAVHNQGPAPSGFVTVSDPLPDSTTFLSASPGCQYLAPSNTVRCDLQPIDLGASVQVVIQVVPNQPGTILNSANVGGQDHFDPDLGNNSATELTTVETGPPPPPPPSGDPPVNIELPQIVRTTERRKYACDEGSWENLPPDPTFLYRWYRIRSLGKGRPRLVGSERTYIQRPENFGFRFVCQVIAFNQYGFTPATSRPAYLTFELGGGLVRVPTPPNSIYGNFRIRGIDVFQTVQPNSGAQMFGFPDGSFPSLAGGGTPTNYTSSGGLPAGANPQRVRYVGVPFDATKPATAIVYVDVAGAAPAHPNQLLDVTLNARLGGAKLNPVLTREVSDLRQSDTPWVETDERDDPTFGVQFQLPAAWMALATFGGERLDLEARIGMKTYDRLVGLRECQPGIACGQDNNFRLDDLPVFRLPELEVESLELISGTGDPNRAQQAPGSLTPPREVLARALQVFPGGEQVHVRPYATSLNVGFAQYLSRADHECTDLDADDQPPVTVRDCRIEYVTRAMERWEVDNYTGYHILFGAHAYRTYYTDPKDAFIEPGWQNERSTLATWRGPQDWESMFTANEGNDERPLTEAGHEFGHAIDLEHASGACGGTAGGSPEPWPPDQRGRLQGVKFDHASISGDGVVNPVVDGDTTTVYDLMSYCHDNVEQDAWLSARNWNHLFQVLLDFGDRVPRRQADPPTRRGSANRRAFALGVVGPGGGTIDQVVPGDGADAIPAPDPSSPVLLRALDAGGTVLQEVGVRVSTASEGSSDIGNFIGPVPARAAAVELVRGSVVLDRLERTRRPRVRVLAPKRGARVVARKKLVVRWAASDPDGGPLDVTVDYSPDAGRSWRTIFEGPSGGRAAVPGRYLEGSDRGRIRVAVSDGFNEARDTSGLFRAQGVPPLVRIVRPGGADVVRAGERTLLIGSAFDDRNRELRRRSLTWFVGKRLLGRGERVFARLPAGRVRLRLVARDRRGRAATAARVLRVAPQQIRLLDLRAPSRVGPGARRLPLRLRLSTPGSLRAGGKIYRLGAGLSKVTVKLPRRPRTGLVRVPFKITARGSNSRGRVAGTLFLLRI